MVSTIYKSAAPYLWEAGKFNAKTAKKARKRHKSTELQPELFGRYSTMSLMDMWKECGRLRRVMYGKQMAEERKQALIQLKVEANKCQTSLL